MLVSLNYLNDKMRLIIDSYEPAFQFYCGVIDGVYSTIDFGIERDVDDAFNLQRKYSPKGPLVYFEKIKVFILDFFYVLFFCYFI
jgi:hypothetical protein